LLDTDFQLKFIAPVDTKLHYAQKIDLSSKFETKIVVNLQKQDINATLEDLIALPWQGIQVSPRSVITARQLDEVKNSYKYSRTVLNINSQTQTDIDYLDYDRDYAIFDKDKVRDNSIHDLRQVPWIGKFIMVV